MIRTGCVNKGCVLITVADMRILDSFIHIHDKEKTANAHVQVVTRAFTHAHLQLHTHKHTRKFCNHLARLFGSFEMGSVAD